jgi:hypothetical protein
MTVLEIAQKHGMYRKISSGEYAGPCPKCGGAMRFRIDNEKNQFQCSGCGITGGLAEITAIFPGEFDLEQATNLLRDLNSSIGAEYPDGALEWLRKERRDVVKSLYALENEVDAAYLAENMTELAAKIDLLKRSYLKAFALFLQRPPVIAAN